MLHNCISPKIENHEIVSANIIIKMHFQPVLKSVPLVLFLPDTPMFKKPAC